MAIRKSAVERKRQIMDAAEHLFVSKGFEATSVNDVLNAVEIAKGTFYHHFVSKEAVMDAIIERYIDLIRERAGEVLAQRDLPVHQKLFGVVLAARVHGDAQAELLDELHRSGNATFHLHSQQRTLETVIPIMTGVVREGVSQGVFRTAFPEEAVEMLLVYATSVFDALSVGGPEHGARKAQAFMCHVELLLGADSGSFDYLSQVLPG